MQEKPEISEKTNYYLSTTLQTSRRISQMLTSKSDFSHDSSTSHITHERIIYVFKIILLGDVSVGKTAILTRFTNNKIDLNHICTVGVEYRLKSILIDDKSAADLQLWDTCGQEKYKTITRNYYRDSNGNNLFILF